MPAADWSNKIQNERRRRWRFNRGPNSSSNGKIAILGGRGIGTESQLMITATPGVIASRHPYVVAGIGFVVAMVDGYDTLMLAFIAPLISKEWAMHREIMGVIFASSYAGAALGATAIGIAADRFGRKTMLLASLALVAVFTMLCARSANPAQLMVLRALAGLGLGGALSTSIALVAENAAVHQRRAIVTRMFLGFPIGAIVGGAITAGVMSSLGWRGGFLAGGVCALLLIPLVAFGVTESAGGAQIAAPVHSHRPLPDMVSCGRAWGTLLSCVGLRYRRRAFRSMRPIGVDHRRAGRGLPGVRKTGMEPAVSVGGCARDVGCECHGSARSITTKRGRAPMNCSDNAARRNETP